jgi:hypothetical protein
MSRIGIVGCSARKLGFRSKARDLYRGRMFELSLAYAEASCRWAFVVSGLHGLVDLDDELDPYDVRLPTSQEARTDWVELVVDQLWTGFSPNVLASSTFVVLAGHDYVEPFVELASVGLVGGVEEPLRGMGIGQRVRWLLDNAPMSREAKASGAA